MGNARGAGEPLMVGKSKPPPLPLAPSTRRV
jgi:hypothetical protein